MTSTPSVRNLGLATLALLITTPAAFAQDNIPTGWYAGGSVGRSMATIDDDRIRGGLARQGLATTDLQERDNDTGYKLFGGYQLNRNFGLELGFFDLGKLGYTANTSPAGSLTGDMRVKGLNLDLVGNLPLTGRLSAIGRAGVTSTRTTGSFSSTGAARVPYASDTSRERSTNFKLGAGLMYDFTDALAMRVEAERYRIKDSVGNKGHVDLVSVGLIYRFGASPAPMTRAAAPMPAPAPAPMPVAVAPAPAPAPVIVAAPPAPAPAPAPRRFTLSADSVFDFDQSTVKPAGKQALDKLAMDLKGGQYDKVQVIGHTDRLGSAKYNAALSSRRAEAVAAYLAQSAGIPSNKITVQGGGEDAPVTKAGDCKGDKATPKLVACLQPDRRVDVEVVGTR